MSTINKTAIAVGLSAVFVSSAVSAATLTDIGEFTGNAGVGTSNGVVSDSAVGDSYVFVSTSGGDESVNGLGLGGETNGSELTTNSFLASAGDVLTYYFNYVTSDGSGFADYAYAQLLNASDQSQEALLFTARTHPTDDIVPGFGLPDVSAGVSLTPSSSAIIPGGPAWDELGDDSGACFDDGCGYTGWIQSSYTIEEDGEYQFLFGVVNWSDTAFDTGFAVAGLTVGDTVIIPGDPTPSPVPLPAGGVLLLSALAGFGALRRKKRS